MDRFALTDVPALLLRELGQEDIPAVSELAGRIWRAHYPGIVSHAQIEYMLGKMYSPESLARQIEAGHRFTLAYHNEALAGYLAVEEMGEGRYFLHKLYVDMRLQGMGIGGALLKHAEKAHSPSLLTLHVNRANIGAINFYFRHGFGIDHMHATDIGEGYVMDDFVMIKRV